jgi:glutathione gamma-glutamylcysteinyltransferase
VNERRHDSTSLVQFENDLISVTKSTDKHMVVSYSRKTLQQTGDGHFSPIGAYNPETQHALVLDVARFDIFTNSMRDIKF